jgi:CDP-diacylglycerol--glycerol-3-phosphate 3-phosphatidyltransferase
MDWFDSSALGISVDSNDVYFIHTPEEFYSTLQNKIRNAKHRIYLSSLYMGTGSLEHALVSHLDSPLSIFQVDEIGKALSQNTNLRAYVLFDYLRGTRGGKESTLELFGQKRLTGLDVSFYV